MLRTRRLSAGLMALAIFTSVHADEQLEELLSKLPASTNAIVIINAQAIFDSPMAKNQNWATKNEERFASGVGGIPPMAKLAVLGSEIDDQTRKARMEVGLVSLKAPVDMARLAIRERGKVETIANLPTVESARNGYFGKFGDQLVGLMFPASRREYAKWVRMVNTGNRMLLSPYLKEAARVANEAPIVVALDAADATDEERVAHTLKGCSAEAVPADKVDEFARTLATIRGVTFAMQIQDSIFGKVQIDLGKSAEAMAENVKPLFLEIMQNNGLMIEDFKMWTSKVDGSTVSLSGPMSGAGLRQVLALVTELPSGTFEEDAFGKQGRTESDSAAALNPKLTASQKYYKSTVQLLDDLRQFKAQTTGQNASMHERYALKIDRMPIYNVDEELLSWGAGVSDHLRAVAMSLRGANIEKGIIDTSKPTTGAYIGFGGYGIGTGGTPDSSAYWGARKQAIAKGTQARLDQWEKIDQETAEIRRAMVAKYMADF